MYIGENDVASNCSKEHAWCGTGRVDTCLHAFDLVADHQLTETDISQYDDILRNVLDRVPMQITDHLGQWVDADYRDVFQALTDNKCVQSFRIKRHVTTINGVELKHSPMTSPPVAGTMYWYPDLLAVDVVSRTTWMGGSFDQHALIRGQCFAAREGAEEFANALIPR